MGVLGLIQTSYGVEKCFPTKTHYFEICILNMLKG